MRMRKGLMLLDVLIIILAVAVVATIVLPYVRTEEEVKLKKQCRDRLKLLSEAQLKYFETGGKDSLTLAREQAVADSIRKEAEAKKPKGKKTEEVPAPQIVRVFTDKFEELKKFAPADTSNFLDICPFDGRQYVFVARDSFFFSISCPNGHGQIILGAPTWEDK